MTFATPVLGQECAIDHDFQLTSLDDEHLLIAVLRVNNRPVAQSIDVYQLHDKYMLPISQLGVLLDLKWHFDANAKRFYSDYNASSNPLCNFDIDISAFHNIADNAASNGLTYLWLEDEFDTYIDVDVVAKLLQGDVAFNQQLQQLNFTSSDANIGLTSSQSVNEVPLFNNMSTDVYPIVRGSYAMFTPPIIDYSVNLNASADASLTYRVNANTRFDVMGVASEYRINSSTNNTQQFFKLSKNIQLSTEQASLTGNVQTINDRAIKYEFGDISLPGDELLFSAKQALGFNMFSFSQNQRRNFSSTRIEEVALLGWRALLFRNGQFVAEQTANQSNVIVFEDVPTFIGINTFDIQLFGPEGQEEFRRQVLHVGDKHNQAKQFDFGISASDAGKSVFDTQQVKSEFDRQITGMVSYGITNRLTINAQWQELLDHKERSRFLTSALDYTNWNSLVRLKYATDTQGGHALFSGLNTSITKNVTGNLSYKHLSNFSSQLHTERQGLKDEVNVRVNGRVTIPTAMGLNVSFKEQRYKDQSIRRALSLQSN